MPGDPPKAETLTLTGDQGEACAVPWALQVARANGYEPNCE